MRNTANPQHSKRMVESLFHVPAPVPITGRKSTRKAGANPTTPKAPTRETSGVDNTSTGHGTKVAPCGAYISASAPGISPNQRDTGSRKGNGGTCPCCGRSQRQHVAAHGFDRANSLLMEGTLNPASSWVCSWFSSFFGELRFPAQEEPRRVWIAAT